MVVVVVVRVGGCINSGYGSSSSVFSGSGGSSHGWDIGISSGCGSSSFCSGCVRSNGGCSSGGCGSNSRGTR